jgi:regulator of sigma E protease
MELVFGRLLTIGIALSLSPFQRLMEGTILFYTIKVGGGRPVSQNAQKWGMRIGLSLVLALKIFTTISDVVLLSAS